MLKTWDDPDNLSYDFSRDVWCVLGLPFDDVTMQETIDWIGETAMRGRQNHLTTTNVNWICQSLLDHEFRKILLVSDRNVVDGMPILWITRFLGLPLREKVSGSNLVENLMKSTEGPPVKLFIFGAGQGVAQAAIERINSGKSRAKGTGWCYPGWGTPDELAKEEHLVQINQADPDFLIVGLTAQKGTRWIERVRSRLSVKVLASLGVTPEFIAGRLSRAPGWIQELGLEWVWRMCKEPYLIRRYALDGRSFLRLFLHKILPLRLFLWRHRAKLYTREEPSLELCSFSDHQEMRLKGTCNHVHRNKIRRTMMELVKADRDMVLDLRGVDFMDSSFLGTLLLLKKYSLLSGRQLGLTGMNPLLARMLRLNLMDRDFTILRR